MIVNLELLEELNRLILEERTGGTERMSKKLGISKRHLLNYISRMKVHFEAPIYFDRDRNTYLYTKKYSLFIGDLVALEEELKRKMAAKIIEDLKYKYDL